MSKVTQVTIPPLEELVLTEMPNLERCSCNSTRDLNSSLRVLMIVSCDVLKSFPLFESCVKLRIKHKSWLSGLSKLTIHDCPQLIVSNPLPPSSSTCKLSIFRVSTLPHMEGSSNGELRILGDDGELMELDDKKISFHNLRALTRLVIEGCDSLSFISLKGFKQLISLKSLEIYNCMDLFSSDVLPEQVHEDTATANFNAFPALKHLIIVDSRISGKWLSVMLRHAPILEELHLDFCEEISGLLIEGKESCLSNHNSSPWASSPGNPDDASTSSAREGLVHIPSNLILSLKKLSLLDCDALTFLEKKASFSAFISLEELEIWGCPKLCPWMNLNCLKKLTISKFNDRDLEFLKLDSCTKLEELILDGFASPTALEGLQSLQGLRCLDVFRCPRLPLFLERLPGQVSDLFPRLERLGIDDYSFLTTSFCMRLASLQRLVLYGMLSNRVEGLTGEQARALQLITTLEDLEFSDWFFLVDLPVCVHSLSFLKRLGIINCPRILRLPEKGLPPSLEELEIKRCSVELTSNCRMLATSMLKVKIDGDYVIDCSAAH